MTPLYVELNRWRVTPWAWGRMDCMLSLADWCVACGLPDPAADVRMTYHDRSSCQRETGFLRDPMSAVGPRFAGIGLPVVKDAREGDVAVLAFAPYEHVGAVWTEAYGWASKDEGGVTFYSAALVPQVTAIWGVGYAA